MQPSREFVQRHIGPRPNDIAEMLATVGYDDLETFIADVVPASIRRTEPLNIAAGESEAAVLAELAELAGRNRVFRSYIGRGYYGTITPPVIQRNVLENPGWYTAYTPYQPEIAQGRLEALLTFQTVVSDLTALPVANASLLDEATAAAEAMALTLAVVPHSGGARYLVDDRCHPQTIAVVTTRAAARGIEVVVADPADFDFTPTADGRVTVGCLVQYPATDGALRDFSGLAERAHAAKALVTAATDLLALTLITPPGEWGADIAVGSSQRFGVPMGYGGPHAAFLATSDRYKRHLPGRIIGVSKDVDGRPALRMALQTREQHIRRDKATSNVCTAQVLLAVIAAMYAVYHGPDGLRRIARRVHGHARALAAGLSAGGLAVDHADFFDTVSVSLAPGRADAVMTAAREREINLLRLAADRIAIAFDETTTATDVNEVLACFGVTAAPSGVDAAVAAAFRRESDFLTHTVFHAHRSETAMLRYLRTLESRDLSLTAAMIPLGSCTMKLNATAEMIPITWPGFAGLHPFVPRDQAAGYTEMFSQLEAWLAEITGFSAVSLQPNAGSQGEFAGLMTIRAYHQSRGEPDRNVCLIPTSAHGTNPASAVMAGMRVVPVAADADGNIDVTDLRAKAEQHAASLAALMVTYPSTHGVFEASIREICEVVHAHGGQVYLDGANMNAQVGLCRPGDFGADVCHLNLHKTFCIPHGGGGPGMGPIGVAAHLVDHLPDHPVVPLDHPASAGTISAAPWGSASILPISWVYIRLMGGEGLTEATRIAILAANYLARRLQGSYDVLYTGPRGLVAHECILDTRGFKQSSGVEVEDIAKRLIDFGFHPPTVSFPVAGTLMIEPTESEPREELDRFVEAMIAIREEIAEIERGAASRDANLLTGAPHTMEQIAVDEWTRPYSRERAAFPTAAVRLRKSWPTVGRIDQAYGDRHLICTCPPMESYS